MISIFAHKDSRFRILNRKLTVLTGNRKTIGLSFLLFFSVSVSAQEITIRDLQKSALPISLADRWGQLQIQNPSGRIEPVDTYTASL